MCFGRVNATLTQLRRDTTKVVRPALQGHEVTITEHGEARLKVVAVQKLDRRQACEDLMTIGPVNFQPRK